ncbi:hypothetical protein IEQ34_015587 [Dendrobium chrysotoxum]|uniref:Uncharacterized protein n=1 Tax=Dendrobium chrysotoxum TaxID=161865 RepID=A0AAV7GIC8_DENCH|nr:hypothetical protein IEQ34_015587 [Dendrobium chrysotoxum]
MSSIRIVAGTSGGVHQKLTGVSRICSLSIYSWARRRRLKRRVRRAHEEAAAERISNGAGNHAG